MLLLPVKLCRQLTCLILLKFGESAAAVAVKKEQMAPLAQKAEMEAQDLVRLGVVVALAGVL
jgi:hypothetical protein